MLKMCYDETNLPVQACIDGGILRQLWRILHLHDCVEVVVLLESCHTWNPGQ